MPKIIRKSSIVSLILVIPLVTIVNYLAHTDGSWYNFSVIGIRIFDAYPIDDFIWGFFYFYYNIMVYEYFFERERILTLPKRFVRFEVIALLVSILFSLFIYVTGSRLVLEYSYLWLVLIIFLLLPALIFIFHRKIFIKAVLTGIFFLPLTFLYEYVASVKGNWLFPGENFIGYVNVLGITFPFEELLWLFMATPAIIAYYEFFADDDR